jgi:serine protease Do
MNVLSRCVVLTVLLLSSVSTNAQAQKNSPEYSRADAAFSALKPDNRVLLEVFLTAAGYYNSVPQAMFSTRLFNAVKQFQGENGYPQTGALDSIQLEKLTSVATSKLNLWGFERIRHPSRPVAIWVPMGLGMTASRTSSGIDWKEPKDRLRVTFISTPAVDIDDNFSALIDLMESKGAKIHYRVKRPDWFVISFTTAGSIDGYARYHRDGPNVTGFTLFWDNTAGDVNGDRIATLMSGSLWAVMLDKPFPAIPRRAPVMANAPSAPASQTPAPAPGPKESEPRLSSGTGFFVSSEGHLVTNAHVVEKCEKISIKASDGTIADARRLNVDVANDLALLSVKVSPKKTAKLRIGVRLGEGVAAFGYPHTDLLSSSGNFTLGNVTALSGLGDDSRYFQISAPVQSGNSGGPLLDTSGNVVGVVSAKLNALKVALQGGDLPQNVNFAVKSVILATYLNSNDVAIHSGSVGEKPLDSADLADRAKEISAFVLCGGK